jgi:ribonuclease-3
LLFQQFPNLKEGDLSRLRANLVRQEALAEIAADLQVGDVLRLGEGELKSGGFRRPSILADTLEAIFGAIYLDAGFDVARSAIERLYRSRIDRIDPRNLGKDAKTALQEWLQGRRLPLPHYELAETHGEAHAQEFVVHCSIPAIDLLVTGRGGSRRAAEQEAAQSAIAKLTHS